MSYGGVLAAHSKPTLEDSDFRVTYAKPAVHDIAFLATFRTPGSTQPSLSSCPDAS